MKRTAAHPTILLAGDDAAFAGLVPKLTSQRYLAEHVVDGSHALHRALKLKPSLVVIDAALSSLPAPRFAEILRSNRRGGELAVVFVGNEGEDVEGFVRHRDAFFPRPLNLAQFCAYIDKHFKRLEQSQQLLQQKQEVKGSLDQLGITDLLQLFGLNGKTGTLSLERGAKRGTVLLENGQIIHARLGRVEGEKALYRLLLWTSGTFRFSPGASGAAGSTRISAPTDHLIMEGLRLGDETAAQAARLPSLQARMALAIPRERLPQGLRSATREILSKLELYPRVEDLLDHCPYADLQILQVLRVLREKGVISECGAEGGGESAPLLAPAEIFAFHQALYAVPRFGESLSSVVIILFRSLEELQGFVPALHALAEFVPADAGEMHPFAPVELGRLQLSDSFVLRFSAVPAAPPFAPLWSLFARQLFGVITLAPAGTSPEAEKYFAGLGVGFSSLDQQGQHELGFGNRDAWRELFSQFLPPPQPNATPMEAP